MSHSGSDHSRAGSGASSSGSDHGRGKDDSGQGSSASSPELVSSRDGHASDESENSRQDHSSAGSKDPGRSRHQRRYRNRGRNARIEKKQEKNKKKNHSNSVTGKDEVVLRSEHDGGAASGQDAAGTVASVPSAKSGQPEAGEQISVTGAAPAGNPPVSGEAESMSAGAKTVQAPGEILSGEEEAMASGEQVAFDAAEESQVSVKEEAVVLSVSDAKTAQTAVMAKRQDADPKDAVRTPRRYVLANALRMLAVDAVERAQSGHPGMPMGMADIAEVLWRDFLRHNPADPSWPNRDRFVLSNGHGSMLLYGLLYLSGYDLSLEDIKSFRQLRSKTPGHPELGVTPGVETTTGPLGQGLANAVGMAIAEQQLSSQYNKTSCEIIDHYTYVFAGDDCLMEGISHEACSLAGTLGLGKLIVFWDDNDISIDGPVSGWFTEDIPKRFSAYGWQVIASVDGHQSADIRDAILSAQLDRDRPTLICCKTQIGKGSPNGVGTAKIHGSPLGESEVAATRDKLNWEHAPFEIPEDILAAWNAKERGTRLQRFWSMQWEQYQQQYPEAGGQLERRWNRKLPGAWAAQQRTVLEETQKNKLTLATRQASLRWLEASSKGLPELIGGAADVSDSVNTKWTDARVIGKNNPYGNYIHYGVREFAMSAILNGLALHGGFIPFAGTYLVFSDYARNAIRMAALMKQPSIFVYSHDSIAIGEDGPTHQPIEQVASLRLIPGLEVWRPADAAETMVAWRMAVERAQGPTSLILTRQKVEPLARTDLQLEHIAKGGYIIYEPRERLKAIILSTGSEVQLAVAAAQALESMGYPTRVVSMPCCERFMQQDLSYQVEVMAPQVTRRISLECGVTDYWYQFIGAQGKALGIDRFGESAPGKDVLGDFGLTVEQITQDLLQYLKQ